MARLPVLVVLLLAAAVLVLAAEPALGVPIMSHVSVSSEGMSANQVSYLWGMIQGMTER